MIMSKSFVDPQTLPPTPSAAILNSLRVYLQVQQWMANNGLNPANGAGHCAMDSILQFIQTWMLHQQSSGQWYAAAAKGTAQHAVARGGRTPWSAPMHVDNVAVCSNARITMDGEAL